jgi:hypothetical protein
MKTLIIATIVAALSYFIYANTGSDNVVLKQDKFGQLWYDGKAELSSFELEQNRYGELHKGTSVLIYVTEDFSKSKQVKLDDPSKAGSDKFPILKLNATKSFLTGIYPYTIINSIFTPIDLSGTVKTSCSVQEWCGHTFMQINKTKDGYKTKQYSYFESEGDKDATLPYALLEDEIWTMIRIDPNKIPQGKLNLVRSNQAVRLMHKPCEVISATISKIEMEIAAGQKATAIEINTDDKKLTIYHDKEFPYAILGWDETYAEFGGKPLTTKARLLKSLRLPYWKLHNNEHSIYRDSLGLNQ